MTETLGPHTFDSKEHPLPPEKEGSFGPSVPGVEHQIVDPVTLEECPPGQNGEIWLRGYSLMLGLHKKERAEVFTTDGWYRTGDGGYLDEDGHLYFTGRMGDLIVYADYAAWQADPRRAADLDRQDAHWQAVLRGAPASGIPADRVPPDAPPRGQASLTVPRTATRDEWLAALAIVLARGGGDDDVVLGVVTEPVLPDELHAVPGPFARMLPLRLPVGPTATTGELAEAARHALDDARRNADLPWPRLRASLAEDPLVSVAVHDRPGALAAHAAATVGLDIAPDGAGTGTTVTAVFDGRASPRRPSPH